VSGVVLRPLDLGDEAEIRAYWEVGREAVSDRPYHQHLGWQAASTYLRTPRSDMQEVRAAAWDGDRMVGILGVQAPLLENTDSAVVFVQVRPGHRHQGVGAALLAWAEEAARGLSRSSLLGWVYAPVGGESDATRFAAHHGFRVELEEGSKVLDLTSGRERWPALAAEAAPHHADYRIVTVWAPIPDALVPGYCVLNAAFMGEVPTGETPVDLEQWDEHRVRDREDRAARAGRRDVLTFALDAAGEVVALTELFVDTSMPHRALQGGTLVMPDHRGHRLGLAIKVANLQALVDAYPQVEWILTENADVNAAMNAVNERLGFGVVERCLEVRKRL
jgi:GNAT superfamily N-acetyltransferase